jgi:hypothetical protein
VVSLTAVSATAVAPAFWNIAMDPRGLLLLGFVRSGS